MSEHAFSENGHAVLSLGLHLRPNEEGDSPRPGLDLLHKAPEHSRQVVEALKSFTYRAHPALDGADEDYGEIVRRAIRDESVQVLIVHIVGHGVLAEGASEKLYVLDHDGRRLDDPVSSWIGLIEDHPDRHRPLTLFVLDVCYAGEAAVNAWHSQMPVEHRRAWVLAATGPRDPAFSYRLSRALALVLEEYRELKKRFDPSVRYIPPATVWRDIEAAISAMVREECGHEQRMLSSLVPWHADLSHLRFFANPSYSAAEGAQALPVDVPAEVARLTDWAVDPAHFVLRASGTEPVQRPQDRGYFSGRHEELRELSEWLDGTEEGGGPGVRVVTGKPGVGKSALLGVLVCAAHPDLREPTEHLWHALRPEEIPGENDRVVVVHARRLGLEQIVKSLSRQIRELPGNDHEAAAEDGGLPINPLEHLVDALPASGGPVTVIIDALDEAVRPEDVTTALLVPLAAYARSPESRIRLLVGTRSDERFRSLLETARSEGGLMDLSKTPSISVHEALVEYLDRVLRVDTPYASKAMRPSRIALAEAIAEKLVPEEGNTEPLEWGEFLTAGLYTHHLLTTEEPRCDPGEAAELGRSAPRDLPSLLRLDLRRQGEHPLLEPVLTALAFAQGRGMPEWVLAHAAAGFREDDDGRPIPAEELYALLDSVARFYLRRDVDEDGTTLYRLFHEGLADWLRNPNEDLNQGEPT